MAIIGRSSYPAGAAVTDVSGGGDTASAYLQALLSREAAQQARRPVYAPQPKAFRGEAPVGTEAALDPNAAMRDSLAQAQMVAAKKRIGLDAAMRSHTDRDAVMQMQARQQGQPMRMTTFGAGNNFYTPDTNAMNAYQREAYLPQGSSRVGTAAEAGAAEGAVTSEAAFNAMLNAQRAGTQNTNLPPRPQQPRGGR